jgi:hypothetical protein
LALFPVDSQLEPVFKKRLHHLPHVFFGWIFRSGSCVDVKSIHLRPTWKAVHKSTAKLADIYLVGKNEQADEGLIGRGESPSSGGISTSAIEREIRSRRTARLIFPDRSYIELKLVIRRH